MVRDPDFPYSGKAVTFEGLAFDLRVVVAISRSLFHVIRPLSSDIIHYTLRYSRGHEQPVRDPDFPYSGKAVTLEGLAFDLRVVVAISRSSSHVT